MMGFNKAEKSLELARRVSIPCSSGQTEIPIYSTKSIKSGADAHALDLNMLAVSS